MCISILIDIARLGDIFLSIPLQFVFSIFFSMFGTTDTVAVARLSSLTDFIKASYRTTQYAALCVQSLAAFASVIRQSER
ncbi:hypothetical protein PS2_037629 [Malus domestica]